MSAEVFVYTLNQVGKVGAWSRYLLPFNVEAFAQRGNSMFVRDGDTVYEMSREFGTTDEYNGATVPFDGVIHWPSLDFGSPGQDTMLHGFDLIGTGNAKIAVGYEQRQIANPAFYTPDYDVPEDTLTGDMIAMPVTAPTLSMKLTYPGGQAWQFTSLIVYVD